MNNKKYLSLKEVAELLNVQTATVRKWIHNGRFPQPDSRLSRKAMFWRDETVTTFVESHSS